LSTDQLPNSGMRTLHDLEATFRAAPHRAAPAGVRIFMFVHDVLQSSTKKPRGVFILVVAYSFLLWRVHFLDPVGCVHIKTHILTRRWPWATHRKSPCCRLLPLLVVHLRHVQDDQKGVPCGSILCTTSKLGKVRVKLRPVDLTVKRRQGQAGRSVRRKLLGSSPLI